MLCNNHNCGNFSNISGSTPLPSSILYFFASSILGIIPNLIIINGIYQSKLLKKSTYYLIANLAICDVLLGMTFIVTAVLATLALRSLLSSDVHNILCKILTVFLRASSYTCSIQTLIIISIERYQAIFRPTRNLTSKRAKQFCLIAWIISFLVSFPLIFTTSNLKKPPKICVGFLTYTIWTTIVNVNFLFFQFIIPAVVMIVLYTLILIKLSKKVIKTRNESKSSQQIKRKTTYMLFTTTLLFLALSTPWAISLGITIISRRLIIDMVHSSQYTFVIIIVRISRYMLPFTALYNPIVYCVFNNHIRQLFYPFCSKNLNELRCTKDPVKKIISEESNSPKSINRIVSVNI